MTYIGIDNGVSGAIAVWFDLCEPDLFKMPTAKYGKRNIVDLPRVCHIFDNAKMPGDTFCILERAQVLPNQGAVSGFNYGDSYGSIKGILTALEIPFEITQPKAWQKLMLAGMDRSDTKAASILRCKQLFPNVSLKATERCTKDDHNMADALLMAEYGRRIRNG